jgi:hypothetical protein
MDCFVQIAPSPRPKIQNTIGRSERGENVWICF